VPKRARVSPGLSVLKAETGTIAWSADKFGAINRGQIQAMIASMTGWNTARCKSFFQPRSWHQTVMRNPGRPVSPATI
jgi:hypothetical protein